MGQAQLELCFCSGPPYALVATSYRTSDRTYQTDIERDGNPIKWTAGVRGYVVLLLRWAAAGGRSQINGGEPLPEFPAERGSPGKKVLSTLYKELEWRKRIFGPEDILDLIAVRRRSGKPWLRINDARLDPKRIVVSVDGKVTSDPDFIDGIADSIESEFDSPPHVERIHSVVDKALGDGSREQLTELAAFSLEFREVELSPAGAAIIGQARQIQLAFALRLHVEWVLNFMGRLEWEVHVEPMSVGELRQEIADFLKEYAGRIHVTSEQAPFWPDLKKSLDSVSELVLALRVSIEKTCFAGKEDVDEVDVGMVQTAARQTQQAMQRIRGDIGQLREAAADKLRTLLRVIR